MQVNLIICGSCVKPSQTVNLQTLNYGFYGKYTHTHTYTHTCTIHITQIAILSPILLILVGSIIQKRKQGSEILSNLPVAIPRTDDIDNWNSNPILP